MLFVAGLLSSRPTPPTTIIRGYVAGAAPTRGLEVVGPRPACRAGRAQPGRSPTGHPGAESCSSRAPSNPVVPQNTEDIEEDLEEIEAAPRPCSAPPPPTNPGLWPGPPLLDKEVRNDTLVVSIGDQILKDKAEVVTRIERRRLVLLRERGESRELTFERRQGTEAGSAGPDRAGLAAPPAGPTCRRAAVEPASPADDVQRGPARPLGASCPRPASCRSTTPARWKGFQVNAIKAGQRASRRSASRNGDTITEFNGIPINSPAGERQAAPGALGSRPVFRVQACERADGTRFRTMDPIGSRVSSSLVNRGAEGNPVEAAALHGRSGDARRLRRRTLRRSRRRWRRRTTARRALVTLDFADVELAAVIETIAQDDTNRNFIYDDRVRGRVTIVSPDADARRSGLCGVRVRAPGEGLHHRSRPRAVRSRSCPMREAKESSVETVREHHADRPIATASSRA